MDVEILCEQIIKQNGCHRRVKRWIRGIHPELGTIVRGWTGWETLQELDVIRAIKTINHKDTLDQQSFREDRCP